MLTAFDAFIGDISHPFESSEGFLEIDAHAFANRSREWARYDGANGEAVVITQVFGQMLDEIIEHEGADLVAAQDFIFAIDGDSASQAVGVAVIG